MNNKEYNEFINEFVKKWYEIANGQKEQLQLWDNFFKK